VVLIRELQKGARLAQSSRLSCKSRRSVGMLRPVLVSKGFADKRFHVGRGARRPAPDAHYMGTTHELCGQISNVGGDGCGSKACAIGLWSHQQGPARSDPERARPGGMIIRTAWTRGNHPPPLRIVFSERFARGAPPPTYRSSFVFSSIKLPNALCDLALEPGLRFCLAPGLIIPYDH
jgi:hypothetical protein